jgi:tripartite-type tricarboxylate transporter receptor subunit TctC
MRSVFFAAIAALVSAVASTSASADEPFYKNKRLTILVNYAAGGPSDIEGRLLARHLQKYLEGTPTIIVQNIDGAGGMVGNNYLAEIGPKDGTMMGYFTGAAWNAASEPEKFHVDFKSYEFVAYQPGTSIYFARTDIPGFKSPTDIVKAHGLISGGLSANNAKDLLLRLGLDILGARYKYVTGYQSNNTARLAFQRGEINYFSESPPGYRSVVEPQLVQKGEAMGLYYDPGTDGENFRVPKQVADMTIPPFHELYKKINNGRMPSGQLWDTYLSILTVNASLQRLLVMAPKAPRPAIDTMRAALLKLNDDQAYADEAMKQIGYVPEYVAGPDTNRHVRQALNTTPEMRAFIADYVKKAGK